MIYLVEVNTANSVRMYKQSSKELAINCAVRQLEKDGLAATILTCSDDLEGGKLMPVLSLSVPQLKSEK